MINNKHAFADISSSFSGRFGISKRIITPEIGIYSRNWGAAAFDQATGIHQDLYVHCLLLENQQGMQSIILTADLGWWKNAHDEQKLRQAILAHFDLPEASLIIALSHTHAGPSICSTDKDLPGGDRIIPYLAFLQESMIACIEEARNSAFYGAMTWGYGLSDLACNRDLKTEKGYLIGYNPKEEADATLLVGQLFNEKQELKAVICNYACHPTTFAHENELISPDFVGELRHTVEQHLQVPCLFLQGASGDLAPKKQYVKDPAIVEANGRALGYAVLATQGQLLKPNQNWVFKEALASGAPLALWGKVAVPPDSAMIQQLLQVTVPYKQLEAAATILEEFEACDNRVLKDRLWRKYNTRLAIGDKEEAQIPVWLWRFGDVILVAQANEAYSIYQKEVRAAFPNHCLVFINIANGYVGYLAPEALYDKDIYAVWQSPYAAGSLEILIKETILGIKKYLCYEA